MVSAGSPPGARQRTALLPWFLLTAVVAGVVVALIYVPAHLRPTVAVCGGATVLLVGIATAETHRRGGVIRELQHHLGQQEASLARRLADQEAALGRSLAAQHNATVWLADELLPSVVERLQRGEDSGEILASLPVAPGLDEKFAQAHQAVIRVVVNAVQAEEAMRESAQRALVNVARRVQALVSQQARDLTQMQDRHGTDLVVSRDLQQLDHRTALIGRLAASIAVLGRARPGRQWQKDLPLEEVLGGAQSQILDFARVDLQSITEVGVQGPAVEPLIHVFAELLDNATRYSPPNSRVIVTAVEVGSGVAVAIEDGGIGLTEEARKRVRQALSQASTGIDLVDLGETPRLGLPVVGRLAEDYGLTVALEVSGYGGVRAVVTVPHRYLTPIQDTTRHVPGTAPQSRPAVTGATGPVRRTEGLTEGDSGTGGLPQRRRSRRSAPPLVGSSLTAPAPAAPASASSPTARSSSTADTPPPGLWLDAFHSGRSATDAPDDPATSASRTSQSSDKGE